MNPRVSAALDERLVVRRIAAGGEYHGAVPVGCAEPSGDLDAVDVRETDVELHTTFRDSGLCAISAALNRASAPQPALDRALLTQRRAALRGAALAGRQRGVALRLLDTQRPARAARLRRAGPGNQGFPGRD